jgi:hypothetical protein
MSIIHRKKIEKHSLWLISTVFWVFSPATDRVTFFVINPFLSEKSTWFDFQIQFWISHIFIILILLILLFINYRNGNRYWIPYTLIAAVHLVTPILLVELADSESLGQWFEYMYRPAFSE